MTGSLPPAAVMILGALLVPFLRGRARTGWVLLLPAASLAALLALGEGEFGRVSIFSYELTLVRIDGLSRIFGWLFHIAAFIGLIFALNPGNPLKLATFITSTNNPLPTRASSPLLHPAPVSAPDKRSTMTLSPNPLCAETVPPKGSKAAGGTS